MAIKVNNTTVIDDSRNIIGVALTLTGPIYINSDGGTVGQVIKSTGSGIEWSDDNAGGGGGSAGGGSFNSGITTSLYNSVTSGTGVGVPETNDIFVAPGIAFTFPASPSRNIIESLHLTNTFNNEVYVSGTHDYNSGTRKVPIGQRIIVPYQGSVDILEQPIVVNTGDVIRLQALSGVGTDATGIDGAVDAFLVYSEGTSSNYVGIGSTIPPDKISGAEIYTPSIKNTVIQSIRLVNYNLNIDIDASISIYNGGTVGDIVATGVRQGYWAYNLTVPKNTTIEICQKPKYLSQEQTIVASASTSSLAVHVCGLGYT